MQQPSPKTSHPSSPPRSASADPAGSAGPADLTTKESAAVRDAERSKRSILFAAERLFAQHGYDGVSIGEIASAAGLSRGTPSYFFGSKEGLYSAVLERAFAEREAAVAAACEPLRAWAERDGEARALAGALAAMVEQYVAFLLGHTHFVRLVVRESLDGGGRLRGAPRQSRAMADAFEHVHASVRRRGLGSFDVDEAVVVLLGLTFAPIASRDTYVERTGIDLDRPAGVRRLVKLAVGQLIALILAGAESLA